MGGGAGAGSPAIGPNEILWRLIEGTWYQPDANGQRGVQEAAFVGEISLLRVSSGITEQIVDRVKGGKFRRYGIAELKAGEICAKTHGELRVSADADWPPNAHVLFIRGTGGKRLLPKHPETSDLTDLANQHHLRREPKP